MGRKWMLAMFALLAAGAMALAGCGGGSGSSSSSGSSSTGGSSSSSAKKYTIYLSNNYMGNEWRPQMENAAKFIANSPKYRDRVDLQIRNADLTPAAQIQSLQSIIRDKPDAIMVDAASATALNPTIQQACSAGILVFTFDQVVTAPCAYKLKVDWEAQAHDMIEWMATLLHGKGNLLMDTGLSGIPLSETYVRVWKQTIAKKYPNLHIVGTFSSQYAPGPELKAVSSLLAQNQHIDGILSGGYQSSDIKALKRAGRPLVPMTGLDVNGNEQQCAKNKLPCFFFGAPSYVSGIAIERIVDILSKKKTYPKSTLYFDTNFVTKEGDIKFDNQQNVEPLTPGKNYYPNESPSLITPITYDDWNMTPADVLGK